MVLLLLLACRSPAPAAPTQASLQGKAFGTLWTVRWQLDEQSPDPQAVESAVVAELERVDASMSTWRDDSDLSRARASAGPIAVHPETALVVREALALASATGGAFDPTVQPLVELWGIHGARRTTAPTEAELAAARAQVGWSRVTLGGEAGAPTLDVGGTALDLSAIAKGFAVDEVSRALTLLGASRHMVEVGGEVRVAGLGPGDSPWRLGVDDPEQAAAPGSSLAAVFQLSDAALATSGNYRNRYEVDGQTIVHTLDPRVGRPVETDVLSASVVAPTCLAADGLATALMVLGSADGAAFIEQIPSTEALLLLGDGREVRTSGLTALLAASD